MRGRKEFVLLAAGAAVLLLSWWLRDPLIPYGSDSPGASGVSADSVAVAGSLERRNAALRDLSEAIASTHAQLVDIAGTALTAPAVEDEAFEHLENLPRTSDQGVVLADRGAPVAWAGQVAAELFRNGQGTHVAFTPFYVTLQVALERGTRRAVATSVLHADPPSNQIAKALDSRLPARRYVESFRFARSSDSSTGEVIAGANGRLLLRADAVPLSPERLEFAAEAAARARGAILLGAVMCLLIALAWSDRRSLGWRVYTIGIALAAIAFLPWSSFSNYSRAFDPVYYYSALGGPFTANAGVFAMSTALAVVFVIAIIRARRSGLPRTVAGMLAILLIIGGPVLARTAAAGIALPPWGSTGSLWVIWQIPVFLLLYACWLAAAWLGRIATERPGMVQLRAAGLVAVAAGALSAFLVWNTTTEQRLQLAMRDVAGLQRVDNDAVILLARFGEELSAFETTGTRADALKRYAASDLAAAELQVSLSTWGTGGIALSRLDLAELPFDSAALASTVRETMMAGRQSITQTLGPIGRQLTLVSLHRDGGATSVVATPRTRLVAQDPYAALLGFEQPDQTDPPYVLTLADLMPGAPARTGAMTWRRISDEWHGDQIVATSLGLARAHVEVDIRSWLARIVRAALIIILNLAIAGVLWALGAMAEGGFFRWLTGRARRWGRSYHGRLTLALFMFFVVPAVAFASWSYQRLRGDDRDVRELLVRETLHAAAGGDPLAPELHHVGGETPLFLYASGMLRSSSDSLYEMIAPAGRMLPGKVHRSIEGEGELTASWQQRIANSTIFWGYRAASTPTRESYVLAAPARSDELVLDRRRRDLTLLVLFATAVGGIAAFWLSGIAARLLARDLELSRIEVARAERVLAWGEMARQVAHEIKNPLTPIRLGVQHLRRARADSRIDFDDVLEENVTRILAEIDHLDEIARAFSRYGSAPADLPVAERVDVAAILRDVIGLERIGVGGVSWTLQGAEESVPAQARADELREVLLNVFENARLARARNVNVTLSHGDRIAVIHVEDDGSGISVTSLPRVFEPHFSTRTTGSGLGLAISRRLLESWGGAIELTSEEGKGAIVVITLQTAR